MAGLDLADLLGTTVVVKREGVTTKVPVSTLDGKYIGLYFSAHWCPPCRSFTPLLRSTYAQLKESGTPFEVFFVSSDRSAAEFNDYYNQMPWGAIAFEDDAKRRALNQRFGISGIPTLIILGPGGEVLNRNARYAVTMDRAGKSFPWEGQDPPRQFGPWLLIAAILAVWAIFHYLL